MLFLLNNKIILFVNNPNDSVHKCVFVDYAVYLNVKETFLYSLLSKQVDIPYLYSHTKREPHQLNM